MVEITEVKQNGHGLTGRMEEMALAEARDEGRADAAKWWPSIHEEGFEEGYARARHDIARKLRALAREDPSARSLLIALLDD